MITFGVGIMIASNNDNMPSENTKFFISYAHSDIQTVRKLHDLLQEHSLSMWIDKEELQPGTMDFEEKIRDGIETSTGLILMASENSRRSTFVRDEVTLASTRKIPIYPFWIHGEEWIDCIPMGFGPSQHIDLRDAKNWAEEIAKFKALTDGLTPPEKYIGLPTLRPKPANTNKTDEDEPTTANPYMGLIAFREKDARYFFGRTALIQKLTDKILPKYFVGLLGASGSGKSSAIMAGLIPSLQKGSIEGSAKWTYLEPMHPGDRPIENLALCLAKIHPEMTTANTIEELRDRSTKGLYFIGKRSMHTRIVLYIDQFEELFTLTSDLRKRRQFIELLTTAISRSDHNFLIILSMRADFYDQIAGYREFAELVQNNQTLITEMTIADLHDVIEKPAQLSEVNLSFDPGLVTEMVYTVKDEASALPLLEFTLHQLYQDRQSNTITLEAYKKIGGVKGALIQHAENNYDELPKAHKAFVPKVFTRLVTPGDTLQATTRRRVQLNQEFKFADIREERIMREIINRFVSARLLVSATDNGGIITIEIGHEALIREWNRLSDWILQSANDIRFQNKLALDVNDWLENKTPDDRLYRGTQLAEVEAWHQRNTPTRDELRFINASIAFKQRQEKEREDDQRRRLRRARIALVFMTFLGIIAFGFAVLSFQFSQSAQTNEVKAVNALEETEQQRSDGLARQLAAQAQIRFDDWYDQALLLSIEGYKRLPSPETLGSLIEGLQTHSQIVHFINSGQQRDIYDVILDSSGDILYSSGYNTGIHVSDVNTGLEIRQPISVTSRSNDVAIHPDGNILLAGDYDHFIRLWNLETDALIQEIEVPYWIHTVAFSPDGTKFATSGSNQNITIWDTETFEVIRHLTDGHSDEITQVIFHPDGLRLASASRDTTVTIWDINNGQILHQLTGQHSNWVSSIDFNSTGTILASGSWDRSIVLWDVVSGEPIYEPLVRHQNFVQDVEFSPNDVTLASSSSDGIIIVWNLDTYEPLLDPLGGHSFGQLPIVFRSDTQLIAGDSDGKIILWDISVFNRIGKLVDKFDSSVYNAAYNDAGTQFAAVVDYHSVIVWDSQTFDVVSTFRLDGSKLYPLPIEGIEFALDDSVIVVYGCVHFTTKGLCTSSTIMMFNWFNGELVKEFDIAYIGNIFDIAFSPDGTRIVSANEDYSVGVWDVKTGVLTDVLDGHTWSVRSIDYSPDGTYFVSGGTDARVVVWDSNDLTIRGNFIDQHTSWVHDVQISADSQLFATTGADRRIIIWDANKLEPIHEPFIEHSDEVHALAFHPNRRLLVSASRDHNILLWDLEALQVIPNPLRGHTDWVLNVEFSQDGTRLLSTSVSGELVSWDLDISNYSTLACTVVNRNLDTTEWDTYLLNENYASTCS